MTGEKRAQASDSLALKNAQQEKDTWITDGKNRE